MPKKRWKNCISFLLAVLLAAVQLPAAFAELPVYSSDEPAAKIVEINSLNDFKAFAAHCRLDTWSRNTTVRLNCDVRLSGSFTPIPVFSGTFEGNRHTVSGLKVTGSPTYAGLFGTITSSAQVKELRVVGDVSPAGDSSTAGGLAGLNAGLIENCIFEGTVSNRKTAGGLVGVNEGIINTCKVNADINGGIRDGRFRLADLKSVDSFKSALALFSLHAVENAGGIAGTNSGHIYTSESFGCIGLPDNGKNIGGIAGKNTGYVYQCRNSGTVSGKSAVGGIVGMNLPYVTEYYSSDILKDPQGELSGIVGTIDNVADDLDASTQGLSEKMSTILATVGRTTDQIAYTERLITGFANGKIGEINAVKDYANTAVSGIAGVTSGIDEIGTAVNAGLHDIKTGAEILSNVPEGKTIADVLPEALDYFSASINDFGTAMNGVDRTTTELNTLFTNLDNQKLPEFSGISPEVDSAFAGIMNELKTLTTDVDALGKELAVSEQRVTDNVRDITEKAQRIMNDLFDLLYSISEASLQKIIYDVRDLMPEANEKYDGIIIGCSNTGLVQGIDNTGGIVGSMSTSESLDIDVQEKLPGFSLKTFRYRSIVKECKNYGAVAGSGKYIGGICGDQLLGAIVSCQSYGNLNSEAASFVGGVAGESHGMVKDCFVKSSIRANSHAGGIVGSGEDSETLLASSVLLGNFAYVGLSGCEHHYGGISGDYEGDMLLNYFVENGLNGAGDYSQEFAAAPITKESLLKVENLPAEFMSARSAAPGRVPKLFPWKTVIVVSVLVLGLAVAALLLLFSLRKKGVLRREPAAVKTSPLKKQEKKPAVRTIEKKTKTTSPPQSRQSSSKPKEKRAPAVRVSHSTRPPWKG